MRTLALIVVCFMAAVAVAKPIVSDGNQDRRPVRSESGRQVQTAAPQTARGATINGRVLFGRLSRVGLDATQRDSVRTLRNGAQAIVGGIEREIGAKENALVGLLVDGSEPDTIDARASEIAELRLQVVQVWIGAFQKARSLLNEMQVARLRGMQTNLPGRTGGERAPRTQTLQADTSRANAKRRTVREPEQQNTDTQTRTNRRRRK